MAFADTSKRSILAGSFEKRIVLGAAVTAHKGDLLGYASAEWKLADGNASPYAAKAIAGEVGGPGETITVYKMALVEGFTGGTPGAKIYLGDTAGDYSDSPSGTTPQVVGEMASATAAWVDLRWTITSLTNAEVDAAAAIAGSKLAANARKRFAFSQSFDIDNGAGVTIDVVVFLPSVAITILVARIVYEDVTSGTVAAANVKAGTTVGGAEIFAATALENTKAVGTATTVTLASGAVAAATPIIVRHTGIAATAAGKYHVEFEYTIND